MSSSKDTFKKFQGKIKAGLPNSIQKIHIKLNDQVNAKISESVEKASQLAHVASETAKQSVDQVLIGLEHKGINLRDARDLGDVKDILRTLGHKVLERAEEIRVQMAANPFSPAWLKDVSFEPSKSEPSTESSLDKESDIGRDARPLETVTSVHDTSAAMAAAAAGAVVESALAESADQMQPSHGPLEPTPTVKRKPGKKTRGTASAAGVADDK